MFVGEVKNTATVTFGGIDPEPSNNTVAINTKVIDLYGQINEILAEIKATRLTTGPVVKDDAAKTLVIAIENTTSSPVTVKITVVDYIITPARHRTFSINIRSNAMKTMELGCPPKKYEVIFDGMIEGVYGWTSTRRYEDYECDDCFNSDEFIASNTFRHSELIRRE